MCDQRYPYTAEPLSELATRTGLDLDQVMDLCRRTLLLDPWPGVFHLVARDLMAYYLAHGFTPADYLEHASTSLEDLARIAGVESLEILEAIRTGLKAGGATR